MEHPRNSRGLEFVRSILLNAAPDQVWRALTDERELCRWFCDSANVDLREGGRFALLGPGVLDGGAQIITSLAIGRRMSFSWPLRDASTEVTWELESQLDGTRLTVKHRALHNDRLRFTASAAVISEQNTRRLYVNDLWTYYLLALRLHLSGNAPALKLNLDWSPRDVVELSFETGADSDRAFAALSQAEHLNKWIATDARIDPRTGGELSYGWSNDGPTKISAFEEGKCIAYDWHYADEAGTHVEWRVESVGARARITLRHSGFAPMPADYADYVIGWAGFCARLALYLQDDLAYEALSIEDHIEWLYAQTERIKTTPL